MYNSEKLNTENSRQKFFFTSINLDYLDKAITLWQSLLIFEANAQFITVVVEPGLTKFQLEEQLKVRNFPFELSKVLLAHDIPWNWIAKMDGLSVVEACTAIKASAAKFLLASSLNTQVVYLDPDMQVYGSLSEVDLLLDQSSFVLTPHLLEPPSNKESIVRNEIAGAMVHGVYNLGFFAVKNTRQGFEILDWWESRLEKFCKAETGKGIFTDQKWFDIATIYFNDLSVLMHPGYNVAPWNLAERFLTNDNGMICVDGFPLKIFHFSAFDSKVHTEMLMKFDSSNIALSLNENYRQALESNSNYKQRIERSTSQHKAKEKRNINQIIRISSVKFLKYAISKLLKNEITLNLVRKIPRRIRSLILNYIEKYVKKNLERPMRFREFDELIAILPKWIVVTHADFGGAYQIYRSVSKFLNIKHSSDGIALIAKPGWVEVRLLSGTVLYEVKNEEFKKLITNWINQGSKLVINHINGHEWWLLDTTWKSVKPIVLVHDRAFLTEEIFAPYSSKNVGSIGQKLTNFQLQSNDVWQSKWQELINAAEIVLSPAKWIQLEMKDAFPNGEIIYFPWFDSSDRCKLPPMKITTTPTIIGVVGANNPHKGIYQLKEASRIALEKNLDIRFVLFGEVSASYKHLLKAKNIIEVGQVRRGDLIRAFGDYGISVIWHCSIVQETFSLALSDSFYSGLPIIANNAGAYSERVFDRYSSWLYDPQIKIQNLVEFFSSPNIENHKSIFPVLKNQSVIHNYDQIQVNVFMHKYGLKEMLWLSMLGF
jgi:glycosyltransferase involved in cell wall biosynthesis